MPIALTCPHCGKSTTFPDNYAGQSGPCPHCGQTVTVPPWSGTYVEAPTSSGGGISKLLIILLAAGAGGFMLIVCGGIMTGLMLPAVQASREAARRMSCSNNLKQIGLALHNYQSVHGTLPPAYMIDSAGNPTVSWRVLILPYMEQHPLYNQIDTQQAWNSPANAALLDAQIPTYSCPSSIDPDSTSTNYMVVTGPGTLFPYEQGVRFRDITDGTSNTIAVVETDGQGVHWAAPEDLDLQNLQMTFAAGEPGQMGSRHPGGMSVLFADGSVRFLTERIDRELLRSLLTPAGGEGTSAP